MNQIDERLGLALDAGKIAIFDWDIKNNHFYIAPYWKDMLGFGSDELPSTISSWQKRVHKGDKKRALKKLKKEKKNSSKLFKIDYRLKHKKGHWVWVLASAQILYNKKGKIVRIVGTKSDITEEKELLFKASCQAHIFDHMRNAVISTDEKGYVTCWNAGATSLLGYGEDEIVGQDSAILFPKEDVAARDHNIATLMKKGEHHAIVRLVKKSKDIIYADLSISLLRDDDDNPIRIISCVQDASIRKESEVQLSEQHKYLQSIIDNISDPIMVIKEDFSVELMNSTIRKELKNMNIADRKNPKCYELSHNRSTPCDGENHPCPLKKAIESKQPNIVTHNHRDLNGERHYVELSASPLFDHEKNCIGIIETTRDITKHIESRYELEGQKNILEHQAHHDVLTGLPNRMLFNKKLDYAIEESKQNNRKIALFFIDLDHFKLINDSFGHKAGDEVLKIAAQRINGKIRKNDTLARLGGDEFIIIMEDFKQGRNATQLADKILQALSEPITIEENHIYISCSIGISLYPKDSESAESMHEYADAAMYRAKDKGRNNYQFYTSDMTEAAFERSVMEAGLISAFKNHDLEVYYQPQVNAKQNKLIGMEALVRWQHPTMGLLAPAQFIYLAESTGLIVELDKVVIIKAMRQLSQWYAKGLNPGKLSLNLSMQLFREEGFVSLLQGFMKDTQCKPSWIELEITESQIMEDPNSAIETLNQISGLGIILSIDNFGTWCSSLSYLKKLPIDKLKIDRSFVNELLSQKDDITVVETVIELAESLNLNVMAGGVETKEQKLFLIENGCENMQGYFYGKPMPAEDMETILIDGKLPVG